MGKGKRAFLASLFGFKEQSAGGQQTEESAAVPRPPQQQRYYQGSRVWPRDDDESYLGRYGYADRDIDKKATEFIERVHRGMHTNDQDG